MNAALKALEKARFFDKKIKDGDEICCFHFNDTWCDFADTFHKKPNGKHNKSSTIDADFIKYMKDAAIRHGLEVYRGKADRIDRADFGRRIIWSIFNTKISKA